ncbi:hypothetical protein CY34DRAFT_602923 [Suillus luteus UH-Slu-Lm8-n1]|uniref:Uncharacterized protein n=1 Tax=Suillus luteus UH-Slu-Lm8-n1 TaxID=930992 RepID=A0A0D0B464_9AGAM|nr:hypothetical protein CY34DRAFT_602923 [Suillus luteus UH-Slu-Lm8-n1]
MSPPTFFGAISRLILVRIYTWLWDWPRGTDLDIPVSIVVRDLFSTLSGRSATHSVLLRFSSRFALLFDLDSAEVRATLRLDCSKKNGWILCIDALNSRHRSSHKTRTVWVASRLNSSNPSGSSVRIGCLRISRLNCQNPLCRQGRQSPSVAMKCVRNRGPLG